MVRANIIIIRGKRKGVLKMKYEITMKFTKGRFNGRTCKQITPIKFEVGTSYSHPYINSTHKVISCELVKEAI